MKVRLEMNTTHSFLSLEVASKFSSARTINESGLAIRHW